MPPGPTLDGKDVAGIIVKGEQVLKNQKKMKKGDKGCRLDGKSEYIGKRVECRQRTMIGTMHGGLRRV